MVSSALSAASCSRTNGPAVRTVHECLGRTYAEYLLSVRFWGWSENEREQKMDREEMAERARQGLPLYGSSTEPEWVQAAAYRNSAFSQLKFSESILPSSSWI